MANEVATAARTTVASGTARVLHRVFFDPPTPRGRFVTTQEGVTDLARRRTQTELEMSAELQEWGGRMAARYPWLDDDEDDDEHEQSRPVIVYAGTSTFACVGDRWMGGDYGDVSAVGRTPRDPVWIVEALAHADESVARGDDIVRGAACRVWEFRLDPASLPESLVHAGGSKRRPPRLAGDAWIDLDGRLRRVTWTQLQRRRPRWPRKPPTPPAWQTTELWDFGVPVEIEVPRVEPERTPPWPIGLMQLAWTLWRRKRAYERRQPRT